MIVDTDRGTIVSDQPNTYLRSETTLGGEIRLADWDSKDNYIEITEAEYEAIVAEDEAAAEKEAEGDITDDNNS